MDVIDDTGSSVHDARMAAVRRVVIVCFAGVQPLDVTGPHEVFAGEAHDHDPAHGCHASIMN